MGVQEDAERLREQAKALINQRHEEEIRELIEDGGGDYDKSLRLWGCERAVIDASIALAQASGHVDDREEYETKEQAVIDAARALLEEREKQ